MRSCKPDGDTCTVCTQNSRRSVRLRLRAGVSVKYRDQSLTRTVKIYATGNIYATTSIQMFRISYWQAASLPKTLNQPYDSTSQDTRGTKPLVVHHMSSFDEQRRTPYLVLVTAVVRPLQESPDSEHSVACRAPSAPRQGPMRVSCCITL